MPSSIKNAGYIWFWWYTIKNLERNWITWGRFKLSNHFAFLWKMYDWHACVLYDYDYQACICRSSTLFHAIIITLQLFFCPYFPSFVIPNMNNLYHKLQASHLASCGGDFDINQPFLWTIVTLYEGSRENQWKSMCGHVVAPKLRAREDPNWTTDGNRLCIWVKMEICIYIYNW